MCLSGLPKLFYKIFSALYEVTKSDYLQVHDNFQESLNREAYFAFSQKKLLEKEEEKRR